MRDELPLLDHPGYGRLLDDLDLDLARERVESDADDVDERERRKIERADEREDEGF